MLIAHYVQLWYIMLQRTVLIIFPLIRQTVIITQMLFIGESRSAILKELITVMHPPKHMKGAGNKTEENIFVAFQKSITHKTGYTPTISQPKQIAISEAK